MRHFGDFTDLYEIRSARVERGPQILYKHKTYSRGV